MTANELNSIIRELRGPQFDHVSKTYQLDNFINVAWKWDRHTINLSVRYSVAQQILQSLRKK